MLHLRRDGILEDDRGRGNAFVLAFRRFAAREDGAFFAAVMPDPFTVETPHGTLHGGPGDFVLMINNHFLLVPRDDFFKLFREDRRARGWLRIRASG